MMRRTCLWLFVLLASAFTPLASAAPVVDPLIGVRGTLSSSPAITDSALQPFGSCSAEGLVIAGGPPTATGITYFCAPYSTAGFESIVSLDLQFFDANRSAFSVNALTLDFANSIFDNLEVIDGITVRLSNTPVSLLAAAQNGSYYDDDCPPPPCAVDDFSCLSGLVIFTAAAGPNDVPASFVSVRAVNGISNTPEPAAMLLLGAGVVAVWTRRQHRRA